MKETIDPIIKETFTLTLQYEMTINTDTGELLDTKLIKRSVDKANFKVVDTKKSISRSSIGNGPKLILESNKYQLTQEAVDLLGVLPDDKIDIKYEKQGKSIVPVIASDDTFNTRQGNRLTKSLTVACRGSKNSELSKFGSEFTLVKHPTKEGVFLLQSGNEEKEEEELSDINLQELIDDEDAEITEVTASMFQL